jgi:hypothetical protein
MLEQRAEEALIEEVVVSIDTIAYKTTTQPESNMLNVVF